MHSYSVNLRGNYQRASATIALHLQVLINGSKKNFPLHLRWPVEFFDKKKGIRERFPNDQEYYDNLMIINNRIAKINDVFRIYRLQDTVPLTLSVLQVELKTYNRRLDFMTFMELKINERRQSNLISEHTKAIQKVTLHKLQEFTTELKFYQLDDKFIARFVAHLQAKGNSPNTIWGHVRDIKAYLELASADKITVNADHKKYKTGSTNARIIYLDELELKKMYRLFLEESLDVVYQESLRAFLFQCFTSLRISDVFRANWLWVDNNNDMVFIPKKNERNPKAKEIRVPLGEIARSLISKNRGLFFDLPKEQTINEKLKDIARELGIRKKISTHVGRHTFGTLYYKKTKDVITLSKIMGHSKIETTMVYVHINDEDKRSGVSIFEDDFINPVIATSPLKRIS